MGRAPQKFENWNLIEHCYTRIEILAILQIRNYNYLSRAFPFTFIIMLNFVSFFFWFAFSKGGWPATQFTPPLNPPLHRNLNWTIGWCNSKVGLAMMAYGPQLGYRCLFSDLDIHFCPVTVRGSYWWSNYWWMINLYRRRHRRLLHSSFYQGTLLDV